MLENLAWACYGCNGRKQIKTEGIDPATGQMAAFYNPRTDCWTDHFRWGENTAELLGKTPAGRATIDALGLNRPNVVRLRQLLMSAGLHPPVMHPDPARPTGDN